MVEELIEREAVGDLITARDDANVEESGSGMSSDAVESPDGALDLTACLGGCRSIYNAAAHMCRNNVGSLVGHSFL